MTKKSTKKTTPKKRTTVKKTVKKVTPASANVTFYNSKGKPTTSYVFDDKGQKKDNLKKGSKVSVLAQATINGQLMYAIHQTPWTWVPAKDVKTVKVDYFTGVRFTDYYGDSNDPTQNKAKYDANLAKTEKNKIIQKIVLLSRLATQKMARPG